MVNSMLYSWLFPCVAAVVHHGPAGAFEQKPAVSMKRLLSECFSVLSSWSNFRHHDIEKQASQGVMNLSACGLGVQWLRSLKAVGFCSKAPAGSSCEWQRVMLGALPPLVQNHAYRYATRTPRRPFEIGSFVRLGSNVTWETGFGGSEARQANAKSSGK